MKIKIGYNEIEIRVKKTYEDRANKSALYDFLNELSIMYKEAAEYDIVKFGASARTSSKYKENVAKMLYDLLDNDHYYDDIR